MARPEVALLAACWAFAALGAGHRVDPAAADALWERAAGRDPRDPAWIDAARTCAPMRPWHAAWRRCRARLDAIDRGRRP